MSRLATIRTIDYLDPIPNADAIEVATIGGWKVVVKKGEFIVGELCVFFEIDSFLPPIKQFSFLGSTKQMNGEEGYRLRTIKLRGQISQGLALPLSEFSLGDVFDGGDDVTEILGVKKYEKPISASDRQNAKGYRPSFIRKTDEERIQNISPYELKALMDVPFYQTLKRDGSSITIYRKTEEEGVRIGVCSRNLDLDGNKEGNKFWNAVRAQRIDSALEQLCAARGVDIALQGELFGEGIQANPHKFNGVTIEIFNVWDIENQEYYSPDAVFGLLKELEEYGASVTYVPHYPQDHPVALNLFGETVEQFLQLADNQYKEPITGGFNEGHVYKSAIPVDGQIRSFKVVSNQYLLKVEE